MYMYSKYFTVTILNNNVLCTLHDFAIAGKNRTGNFSYSTDEEHEIFPLYGYNKSTISSRLAVVLNIPSFSCLSTVKNVFLTNKNCSE